MNVTTPNCHEVRHAIQDTMAKAIKHGTGAVVEVTLAWQNRITVSGDQAQVVLARPVLEAAGLVLVASEYDAELAEAFDYWQH